MWRSRRIGDVVLKPTSVYRWPVRSRRSSANRILSWRIRRPRPDPRNKTWNGAQIPCVGLAETGYEHRFFEHGNVDEVNQREQDRPFCEWSRTQDARFADEDEDHATDHRVTDEAIGTVGYELTRRVPGRQRPASPRPEVEDTGHEEHKAVYQESDPNQD